MKPPDKNITSYTLYNSINDDEIQLWIDVQYVIMNVYNISETQENTMDKDKGVFMTAREVNMEIEMLKTVFDIV